MADEYFSFEEALSELRLKEEELKRLVSEGEIRAHRDGDTMKLSRRDVEQLRTDLSGGEVVDLGDVGEDLVFEDDDDLVTGMATEEISSADTILEDDVDDVDELDLDDDIEEVAPARVSRRSPVAAAAEEEDEGAGMKVAMILTSLVLVAAMPVCVAIASGNHQNGLAKGIAGIFSSKVDAQASN